MVCFHPIHAYYPMSEYIDFHTGELKRKMSFSLPKFDYAIDYAGGTAYFDYYEKYTKFFDGQLKQKCFVPQNVPSYIDVKIPCGKCIGCHADRARNYTTRAVHEYYFNRDIPSCFVTLTFNEEMLRKRDVHYYKSISRTELSGFIKRLRERVYDKYKITFRVFGSGEYGELKSRPHYHLIIYGFDFPDKYAWKMRNHSSSRNPIVYYRSPFLEKLWSPPNSDISYGFSTIGTVTPSSCQYVSGYMADKLDEFSDKDYKQLGIDKPFLYTPSRPGLGFDYFMKFHDEIFDRGFCSLHNSIKTPIPAYYCDLLKKYFPERFEVYKLDKLKFMINNLFVENVEISEQRLRVREDALKMKYDKSIRSYEEMSFLHNIYYRHLSTCYKKAMNALKLLDFNFKLSIDDARVAIQKDNNKYNFIFLDAFTPVKCPCLWTVDFFKLLYERLEDDGMILTYSNSALVRNAFINAGFYVGKIYSESAKKFTGTIAVKKETLIKHELSEYDLGLMKTKAGIFYRDENLSLDNEAIIATHKIEVENSKLMSSSKYIKNYRHVSQ